MLEAWTKEPPIKLIRKPYIYTIAGGDGLPKAPLWSRLILFSGI